MRTPASRTDWPCGRYRGSVRGFNGRAVVPGWFRSAAEIPATDDRPERMTDFEEARRRFFHPARYGNPRENVERLLRSVGPIKVEGPVGWA